MSTIKIRKKKMALLALVLVSLVSVALLSAVWVRTNNVTGKYLAQTIQNEPIKLDVPTLTQLRGTSCGEAVIVMAYNYGYPQDLLKEADVIAYAADAGYFTEGTEPFTSPANMVKITRHYITDYSSGTVYNADQGLALLIRKLKNGEPVIIDVLTHLDDPTSNAHFVLVTGIEVDPNDASNITIYFNNPLTGASEHAPWGGETGIWHAWDNNPDPGGSGWWLVIPPD